MTIDPNHSENVRNYYRRQGIDQVTEQIIRNIQLDGVISMAVDVRLLERLVLIIDATREEVSASL